MSVEIPPRRPFPVMQAPAVHDGALAQNTWVTVLDSAVPVRVHGISFDHDTDNEDMEIEIIHDAITETKSQTVVAGTPYYIVSDIGDIDATDNFLVTTVTPAIVRSYLFDAESCRVRVRKTSALGAANGACKVIYSLW